MENANDKLIIRDEKNRKSWRFSTFSTSLERRWYGCCLSNTVTRNGHRRGNIRKGGYSGCVAMPDRTPQPPANRQLLLSASSRALKLLERRLRYFWDADADDAARLEIRAVFSFLDTPDSDPLRLFFPPAVSLKSDGFLLVVSIFWTSSYKLSVHVHNDKHTHIYISF